MPIIDARARKLDDHRRAQGDPVSGPMYPSRNGTPLNLDNLAGRVLRPTLKRAGLRWHGWHAFRRGLATTLNRLGVADKTIQSILRHADISTTMNLYAKSIPADAAAAMRSLEEICTQDAPNPATPEKIKSVS